MTDYQSTLDLDATAALLENTPGTIVILTHAKPDGDAFGSVAALAAALTAMGRDISAWLVPPVPMMFQGLAGMKLAHVYSEASTLPDAALYVIVDTGAWGQIGPMRKVVEPHLDRTLIIDHHLNGDIPAAHRHIDGQAAASAEIVAQLIERLLGGLTCADETLTRTLCESLFIGIASDTGWFRFSNTRPRTHELAAALLRQGVDHAALYQRLEQGERPQKLALLIRALDSLKMLANGKAAVMVLRSHDFTQTGALEEETERLIDTPQQVGTIQVIVLASEKQVASDNGQPKAVTRLSFRSKPGDDAMNVAELAAQFGGGGHARAAGATVEAPVEQVVAKVEQLLEAKL